MSTLWRIYCMENEYPGMWQRWFKEQCVAVGWASQWGYPLDGEIDGNKPQAWRNARKKIKNMAIGDYVVVALRNYRVGCIGQITGKAIRDDEWDPLVPRSLAIKDMEDGDMGRRIFVRWELTTGPDNQDLVVQLPEGKRFKEVMGTVAKISSMKVDQLRKIMNDPKNWVNLLGKFGYEKTLSDYIGNYPNRLEDGLLPYSYRKTRENRFKDGSRSDVLLIDRSNRAVVVECKQHSPSVDNIKQLRRYMKRLQRETGKDPRGILVHGGAPKISPEVITEAERPPRVEIVREVARFL
ncbi:MAG: endonuclease NucS [Nitrospira sp.]|nr:endonuclease NucS [Nitrospira sp.]